MKSIKSYLLVLLIGLNSIIYATEVTVDIARKAALNWQNSITKSNKSNLTIDKTIIATYKTFKTYYTFTFTGGGFVIVAADDNVKPILGYSDDALVSDSIANENVRYWLDSYKRQIYIVITSKIKNTASNNDWENLLNNTFVQKSGKSVTPLLTTTWDQGCYYNSMCPADNSAPFSCCGHVPTGCVATAMAQILKYHNYPVKGVGTHTYTSKLYGSLTANFGATTYGWTKMPDNVTSSNSSVATLMFHCGVSVDMGYRPYSSGANFAKAQTAFTSYFNYGSADVIDRYEYTDADWIKRLKQDLDASLPILYSGIDTLFGGHAFVFDGYDNSNNFHINWGWSGSFNGYFTLNKLVPNGYNFSEEHAAVVNIRITAPCTAKITAVGSTNICQGGSFELDANSGATYQWLKNNTEITAATNSKFVIQNAQLINTANYSVIVGDGKGCSTTSSTESITVNPLPALELGSDVVVKFNESIVLSANADYISYKWSNGATSKTITVKASDIGVGTFFYYLTVTNITSCQATDFIKLTVIPIDYSISGVVKYSNSKSSVLNNVVVSLFNSENTKLDSYTTGNDGTYVFYNVPNGVFRVEASSNRTWGGVDPIDALLINRNYIGTYTITDNLKKYAADITNANSIDPGDALMINKRFVGIVNQFNIADWIFDSNSITINNSDVIQNINGICVGDVNGDYNPTTK